MISFEMSWMSKGVEQPNKNKVGAPFAYSDACLMMMVLFRNAIGTACKQLQGIIGEVLGEVDCSVTLLA